jgi:hypothetical protein
MKKTIDIKYYAFDWDDNLLYMPTKVILKNDKGKDIKISTNDFAKFRKKIGKVDFEYNENIIVDYGKNPFRYFKKEGDKCFKKEAMLAEAGPAWKDFTEAINNGSVFAIITARGNSPETIKETCYEFIIKNHNGISFEQLIESLKNYRELYNKDKISNTEMIKEYLNMCKFYPVSYNNENQIHPEKAKVDALDDFITYIKKISKSLSKKIYLKNKIGNKFIPTIGFSDDDVNNLNAIKKYLKNKKGVKVKTYTTFGGEKKEY